MGRRRRAHSNYSSSSSSSFLIARFSSNQSGSFCFKILSPLFFTRWGLEGGCCGLREKELSLCSFRKRLKYHYWCIWRSRGAYWLAVRDREIQTQLFICSSQHQSSVWAHPLSERTLVAPAALTVQTLEDEWRVYDVIRTWENECWRSVLWVFSVHAHTCTLTLQHQLQHHHNYRPCSVTFLYLPGGQVLVLPPEVTSHEVGASDWSHCGVYVV